MCVAVCSRPAGRPFSILIQPVQEKFPRPIKLERTGISGDARKTTRTKTAQVHGLDSKIIVLWSSRIYLRLVHSLTFSVVAFSGCFTNILHLEIFFRFHGSPFSGTSRSRETLLHEADKNGEQAINQSVVGDHLRIRSHESNTKRAGL